MSDLKPRDFPQNEITFESIKQDFDPLSAQLKALQIKYADLILELEREASVGNEVRSQLGSSLSLALKFSREAMAMDEVALIKERKFFSEPSGENLEAIATANRKNVVPTEQKQIQAILLIPKEIMANYEQLKKYVREHEDIGDLAKMFIEDSKQKLAEFEQFLENQ